jgi:transcriptional regulator with PAS, ATPase and Fis domain
MDRFNEQFKKGFLKISGEAEEQILSHPWAGNVRELRNAVERIVLLENGEEIREKHLAFLAGKKEEGRESQPFKPTIPAQGIILDQVEKEYLLEALRIKNGNKIQAAKLLGITRSALLYRMEKHGIK